jgi:hypothetical protein
MTTFCIDFYECYLSTAKIINPDDKITVLYNLSEVVGALEPVLVREYVHLIEVIDLQLVVGEIDAGRLQLLLLRLLLTKRKREMNYQCT